jgi:hypothetical protein
MVAKFIIGTALTVLLGLGIVLGVVFEDHLVRFEQALFSQTRRARIGVQFRRAGGIWTPVRRSRLPKLPADAESRWILAGVIAFGVCMAALAALTLVRWAI